MIGDIGRHRRIDQPLQALRFAIREVLICRPQQTIRRLGVYAVHIGHAIGLGHPGQRRLAERLPAVEVGRLDQRLAQRQLALQPVPHRGLRRQERGDF